MGALVAKLIYKNDLENIQIRDEMQGKNLWDYTVKDIGGDEILLG